MDLSGYLKVVERVELAASRSGRSGAEITIVAVSKGHSATDVLELYETGHRDFGENRADEMAAKAAQLPEDIRWHFVGTLQSNKARLVRGITWLLHSVDRVSLAKAWVKGVGNTPPVLIQVDVGDEDQKGGVDPYGLMSLVESVAALGIDIRGLMTIPPVGERPEDSRPHFEAMRRLRDGITSQTRSELLLSMGMTDDYEVAIEEGASMIRVGRAIFGSRLLQD